MKNLLVKCVRICLVTVCIVASIWWAPVVHAQKALITVYDKQTKETLTGVHLTITSLHSDTLIQAVTNTEGAYVLKLTQPMLLSGSFIGYRVHTDTVYPSTNLAIMLEPDVFMLDQFTITASLRKKHLKDEPVITEVITAEQIQSRGMQNVQEVLEASIPGIEFQRHGVSNDINIQGLEGKNILILIDGERLAGETRGNVDYSRLNTNDIERIEIVKGASSALYGSQAMGAVINIITKTSGQPVYGSIGTRYQTPNGIDFPDLEKDDSQYDFKRNLDHQNLNVNVLLGFNYKKLSSKTTFVSKSTDAYELYDTDSLTEYYPELDTTIYNPVSTTPVGIEGGSDYTLSQNFGYQLSDRWKVQAKGSFYAHHKYDFVKDRKHDYFEDLSYGLKASYQGRNESHAIISLHSDRYDKYDYLEKLQEKNLYYRHQYLNPKAYGSKKIGHKNHVTAGVEYLSESLESDMFVLDEMHTKDAQTAVFFIQDDILFSTRWNMVLGLRSEYHSTFKSQFSPKLSIMYKQKHFRHRFNYASGYRSPSLKELYMNWDHLGMFTIQGNEALQAETNQYFSLSTEYTHTWINASANLYYNQFKNKIEGSWQNNQTIYQYQNIHNSSILGLDVIGKVKLNRHWILNAGYTFINEAQRQDGVRLSAVSPHTANGSLQYTYKRKGYRMNATLAFKYIGAKSFDVLNEITYRGQDTEAYYHVSYKGYSTWNLSIYQQFNDRYQLSLGINNLLDYQAGMITFNSSISPGRSYFIQCNVNLDSIFKKQP